MFVVSCMVSACTLCSSLLSSFSRKANIHIKLFYQCHLEYFQLNIFFIACTQNLMNRTEIQWKCCKFGFRLHALPCEKLRQYLYYFFVSLSLSLPTNVVSFLEWMFVICDKGCRVKIFESLWRPGLVTSAWQRSPHDRRPSARWRPQWHTIASPITFSLLRPVWTNAMLHFWSKLSYVKVQLQFFKDKKKYIKIW